MAGKRTDDPKASAIARGRNMSFGALTNMLNGGIQVSSKGRK